MKWRDIGLILGSFILTKWFVNVKDDAFAVLKPKCFILTKWFVNSKKRLK